MRALSPQECLDLLEPGGVGRVGLMSCDGMMMLPVNYAVAAGPGVFRTAPTPCSRPWPTRRPASRPTTWTRRAAWAEAVLVQGRAHKVAAERDVRALKRGTRLELWAAGARDVWVRITPARVSGRRIGQA